MNPALCDGGSRIHKISSTLSKVIGDGGEGGGRGMEGEGREKEGTTSPPFIL